MTMKEWMENHDYQEQKELAEMLESWLGMYTQDVFNHVMDQMDEIINNESSIRLIRELHERMEAEKVRRVEQMYFNMKEFEEKERETHPIHLNPLTHSESYRDVLYDLYIKR